MRTKKIKPARMIEKYLANKVEGYVSREGRGHSSRATQHHFDMGENCDSLPSASKSILTNLDMSMISQYPDPSYVKLTSRLAKEHGLDMDNISLGTGSNEVIERICRTFLDENSTCVVVRPIFFRIEDAVLRCTSNVVSIDCHKKQRFNVTEEQVDKILKIENPKIIWICSPNSVTGVITPLKHIEKLARAMPGTLICVDEAWGDYVKGWNRKHSAINLVKKHTNVIVTHTFSKLFGLASLTIGYAIGPKGLVMHLNNLRLDFPISSLAEQMAISVLDNKEHFIRQAALLSRERERMQKELNRMANIEHIPSSTGVLLIRHRRLNLLKELRKRNILVLSMDNCNGIKGEKWTRIIVQKEVEKNDLLLRILKLLNEKA